MTILRWRSRRLVPALALGLLAVAGKLFLDWRREAVRPHGFAPSRAATTSQIERELLAGLDHAERWAVRLVRGLDGNEPVSVETAAALMGCSVERAQSLFASGWKKMAARSQKAA